MSRLTKSASTSPSQASQSQRQVETEIFKRIVKKCKIVLTQGDDLNVLNQEQSLVIRDLQKEIEEEDTADCIQQFMKGFKILIKKERYFKKALQPTLLKKSNLDDLQITQHSLFRLFILVDDLQEHIINIVLDKVTSIVTEDIEDTSFLRLLLEQLKFMPHMRDSQNLTTKLMDALEIGTLPCQNEILYSLPEILPDSEYNETAKQLVNMLDTNENLLAAIIDCLDAINLDQEIRTQVQDLVLSRITTATLIETFPILLSFLMSDVKSQNLTETFCRIRNSLDKIISTQKDAGKETEKVVIFNKLQMFASTKTVSDTWLTVILNIKVHTDHKPFDLLILFMLYSGFKSKRKVIESVFRKKVKEGAFKCSLLEKLFEKSFPQQLFKNYFESIIEIGSSLLRNSNDVVIIEFASTLFKIIFNHSYVKVTDQREILDSLMVVMSGDGHTTTVLNILTSIVNEKAQNHAVQLIKLLDRIDTFKLNDVELVFEILCSLTCSNESLSQHKEELEILIRKQVSGYERNVKNIGIIAAVIMAKYLATTTEEQSDSEYSVSTIEQLSGRAKEAAVLIEIVNKSTENSAQLQGLYYDQLASMLIKAGNLDRQFVAWLFTMITSDFQDNFVTEQVCDKINDLEFRMEYNLNSEEELENPLAVNIAELTLKPKHSIVLLAPHFRLLRVLHFRQQNGDLSSIDALLGCAVVMPPTDTIHSLDSDQVKQVADCLFHCINWFREVVSAFVTQKMKKLRLKVIQRLGHIIELERILRECLEEVPEHKLPVGLAQTPQAEQKEIRKPPRKKLKSDSIVHETSVALSSKTSKKVTSEQQLIKFREMDTDIAKLLKYPLYAEEEEASTIQTTLTVNQLNFLLKDYNAKLALLTKGSNVGLSHLHIVSCEDIISDCVKILPNVSKHFAVVAKKIEELLEKNEVDSAEMFTEEALQLKASFGLMLECLLLIYGWPGFQHSKRLDLLREILQAWRRPISTQVLNSVNRLMVDLSDRLSQCVDYCLHQEHGVNLVKIMESLHSLTPETEIRNKIAKACKRLLCKKWYNDRGGLFTGKQNSLCTDALVKSYLSNANIKTLCGIVATLQEQAPALKSKTDCLEMLASISKSNFYILYRNLLNSLYDKLKTEIQSLTNDEHLVLWKTVALTMQGLMMVVKSQETTTNLASYLKKCISILKVFLSHGVPILEIMLKSKPDKVVEIFKIMQSSTRFVHNLCCYSKLQKDAVLTPHVPHFRLTLETLVYRVKAALIANNCSDAFWMGNLKNRNLEGDEILSQTSSITNGSDENEEELVEDDESDGDILEETPGLGEKTSASEDFD